MIDFFAILNDYGGKTLTYTHLNILFSCQFILNSYCSWLKLNHHSLYVVVLLRVAYKIPRNEIKFTEIIMMKSIHSVICGFYRSKYRSIDIYSYKHIVVSIYLGQVSCWLTLKCMCIRIKRGFTIYNVITRTNDPLF